MNVSVKALNRTMLLACTPFLGMLLWLLLSEVVVELSTAAFPVHEAEVQRQEPAAFTSKTAAGLEQARTTAEATGDLIKKEITLYNRTNAEMKQIASTAAAQARIPLDIYDQLITSKLGAPSATVNTDKLRAQLFRIKTQNFQSYAVKIELKSDDAMKMALGGDKYGGAETTLAAVKRLGAYIGINAGGFADAQGVRYPLSTTMIDGEYVNGFEPSFADLFFVGLNEDNELVGGKFTSKAQLDSQHMKFGASFVPVLLQNGAAMPIPDKWKNSPKRAPRTVIANYKDNQLLLLVADGYNENGSSGATLEELQILLKRYGAVNGFNLDGGGSSSLIWNGSVINSPSDRQLRKLPTSFLFFK